MAIWLSLAFGGQSIVFADVASNLRLIDPLDRPLDGYCIDVVGTPGNLRTDLPLFAHNCKHGLSSDSAVVFDANGFIRFVDLDLCITVAGINAKALPGASVILQPCARSSVFFNAAPLQIFQLRTDNKLELNDSGLCVMVGNRSAATYSSADRWRPLFVDECVSAEDSQARWQFVRP